MVAATDNNVPGRRRVLVALLVMDWVSVGIAASAAFDRWVGSSTAWVGSRMSVDEARRAGTSVLFTLFVLAIPILAVSAGAHFLLTDHTSLASWVRLVVFFLPIGCLIGGMTAMWFLPVLWRRDNRRRLTDAATLTALRRTQWSVGLAFVTLMLIARLVGVL